MSEKTDGDEIELATLEVMKFVEGLKFSDADKAYITCLALAAMAIRAPKPRAAFMQIQKAIEASRQNYLKSVGVH